MYVSGERSVMTNIVQTSYQQQDPRVKMMENRNIQTSAQLTKRTPIKKQRSYKSTDTLSPIGSRSFKKQVVYSKTTTSNINSSQNLIITEQLNESKPPMLNLEGQLNLDNMEVSVKISNASPLNNVAIPEREESKEDQYAQLFSQMRKSNTNWIFPGELIEHMKG